jgi:hypothetical protein
MKNPVAWAKHVHFARQGKHGQCRDHPPAADPPGGWHHPDTRIFRNQVGSLPDPRTGRLVTFGLARGSADLIGWRTITVTPAWSAAAWPCSQHRGQDPTGRLVARAAGLARRRAKRWWHRWHRPVGARR